MNLIFNDKKFKNLEWTDREKDDESRSASKFEEIKRKELIKLQERKRKLEIDEIKNDGRDNTPKRRKLTTTKVLMYLIFLNCLMIEVYSMWVMFTLSDLSALYSLIGAVIGESISFAVYCAKSYKETKEEVDAKLRRDKFEASVEAGKDPLLEEAIEEVTKAIAE